MRIISMSNGSKSIWILSCMFDFGLQPEKFLNEFDMFQFRLVENEPKTTNYE